MQKVSQKIDSYFLGLILEIFIIVSLFILNASKDKEILDFVMLCITFFIIMITYTGGMIIGLILSSILIFAYASYIFYINLLYGVEIEFISYIWMIFLPTISLTCGKLSENVSKLQDDTRRLMADYENLVMIDEETGLGNIKSFYRDLDREISKSKRHKTYCTLMLVKLPYYSEIRNIIGRDRTNKLIKDISDLIISSTRVEDERYTIDNDTLAIIMPSTDFNGANIVKDRIKQGISDLNLKLRGEKSSVNIDTKIAILQYDENIKSAMEFKILTEEELQYDV